MYAALNEDYQLIYAMTMSDHDIFGKKFYCPMCKQQVVLKKSCKNNYYFAHTLACGQEKSNLVRENESLKHKKGKALLINAHESAITEYYLSQTNQKVDVYFQDNEKIALEYQLSVIAPRQLKDRHMDYCRIGIKDYWITNIEVLHGKFNKWVKSMLQYNRKWGFYLLGLNDRDKTLEIICHLPILFSSDYWHCQWTSLSLLERNWWTKVKNELEFKKRVYKSNTIAKTNNHNKWFSLIKQSQANRALKNYLYSKQLSLNKFPLGLLIPVGNVYYCYHQHGNI